jgi:hypothetical protein
MESNSKQEPLVQKIEAKKVGDTIAIFSPKGERLSLTILKVGSSLQEADRLGIAVPSDIPIYYLDKDLPFMDAGIGHGGDHIVMFPISDDYDLRHELIHSVELSHTPTQELLDLYEKVKQVVQEGSFCEADGETYNFLKDIHEFIVDGYNHAWFISALKREGLYDQFLRATEYMKILK